MVSPNKTIQFEGTWEEILRRGDDLAGRRVRVTILPSVECADAGKPLDQILMPLIERATRVVKDPDPPKLNAASEEFADAIVEQLRKQGLKA